MCEQCCADTINWSLFPGWDLIQARKDGHDMKAGDYGLVRCNNPDVIWSVKPIEDPTYNTTGEELSSWPKGKYSEVTNAFTDALEEFRRDFLMEPEAAHNLVEACRQAGFRREDGDLSYWLFNLMARKVKEPPYFSHSS